MGFFYAFYLDKSINRLNCNRFIFRIFAIMKSFFDVYTNIMALNEPKVIDTAIKVIDSNEVIKLNQEQLLKGKDSEGNNYKDYTNFTIKTKRETGGFISPSGKLAFKDTGDLWRKMEVQKETDFFAVYSSDKKYNFLISMYGKDIFGLNSKDAGIVIKKAQPKFIDEIQKLIFK